MLILFETAAGYALFRLTDESKLEDSANLYKDLKDSSDRASLLQLYKFKAFEDMEQAAEATKCLQDGEELHDSLSKFIKKYMVKKSSDETLAVIDAKLGSLIKDKFSSLNVISNSRVLDLQRSVREHLIELLEQLTASEDESMRLGLSHTLARHKLQFSADKVDTMIVQGIALLDELDKEINIYAMRVKEWYGWHFPEMVKCIGDNMQYCRIIQIAGYRSDIPKTDLSEILDESEELTLKNMAKISMGSEITEEDLLNIRFLVSQVLDLADYRSELYEYIKNRMMAIAPTLTMMVGELVGARLLAHAGSLLSLAKYPASTIQLLGAEKALFRALKASADTPKYGLIYHASYVTSASTANKARVARSLACKTVLASRIDAFTSTARAGDRSDDSDESTSMGISEQSQEFAAKFLTNMQRRLNRLEGQETEVKSKTLGGVLLSKHEFAQVYQSYDQSGDVILTGSASSSQPAQITAVSTRKRKRAEAEAEDELSSAMTNQGADSEEVTAEEPSKKKRKKKKSRSEEDTEETKEDDTTSSSSSKKKKKSKKDKKEKKKKKKSSD